MSEWTVEARRIASARTGRLLARPMRWLRYMPHLTPEGCLDAGVDERKAREMKERVLRWDAACGRTDFEYRARERTGR